MHRMQVTRKYFSYCGKRGKFNSEASSGRRKGKTKKKGSSSASTKTTRPQPKKRKKQESALLDRKQMEEFSAWIFSAEQAKQC